MLLLLVVLLVAFPFGSYGSGTIIFQDNFDSYTWQCVTAGGPPNAPGSWGYAATCTSDTYDGVTHYSGEISSGGRMGNSYKLWKHGSFPVWNCMCSGLYHYFTANTYRDLYTRWYMKLPTDLDLGPSVNSFKLWRYLFGPARTKEIYLNIQSSTNLRSGRIAVAPGIGSWTYFYTPPFDDQWHCYELHLKLDTTGNNDGVVEFWVDGVQKTGVDYLRNPITSNTYDFGALSTDYFEYTMFGTGNYTNTGSTWQTPWRAIEFDDYVLSTSYIGPTPNPPSNLKKE